VALYLFKKYAKILYRKNDSIIDSILFLLNEYTEHNGASKYHHGISHFEELMYFIELFVDGLTYTHAHYFIKIMNLLIQVQRLEEEECDYHVKEKIQKGFEVNQLRNNFIVYSNNPLKTCVIIMNISLRLKARYVNLDKGIERMLSRYIELFTILCNSWGDLYKITKALEDKMYNGQMVIDVITQNNLIQLLKIPKVSLMVSEIWEGKYELESFMNCSLNYQIFKSIILRQKNMIGYDPDYVEELSIVQNLIKIKNQFTSKSSDAQKHIKGHFFMFKTWRK